MINFDLTKDKKRVSVKLTYKVDRELFDRYKTICDANYAHYNAEIKTQSCSLDGVPDLVDGLVSAGLKCIFSPELMKKLLDHSERMALDLQDAEKRLAGLEKKVNKKSKMKLMPHQRTGVKWLSPRRRALLGDEMGIGKTATSLMSIPDGVGIVVICPNIMKSIWIKECKTWRPELRPYQFIGRGAFASWPKPGEMYIFNYDILHENPPPKPPKGVVVIIDEIQMAKNPDAKRSIACKNIRDAVLEVGGKMWGLSGTPMLNRPPELYQVLSVMDLHNETFGNWRNFLHVFNGVVPEGKKSNSNYEWGEPLPEAAALLKRVMLRRERKDVLPDLPEKMYTDITMDLLDKKLKKQLDKLLDELEDAGLDIENMDLEDLMSQSVVFEQLSRIRAELARVKIPQMLEFIEQCEDNEETLVVFCAHRDPIDYLNNRPGWTTITGDTTPVQRQIIIDDFQKGKYKGIGITIASGGVGITLTYAHKALFVDLMWTPASNWQAEDRLARIGQLSSVEIYRLVCNHPVELRVHELLTLKEELINNTVHAATTTESDVGQYNFNVETLSKGQIKEMTGNVAGKSIVVTESMLRLKQILEKNALVKASEKKVTLRRDPMTPQEDWAKKALLQLDGNNPDGARIINGVGFNKFDTVMGRSLAQQLTQGLTDTQWRSAVSMCKKYQKQVGAPPGMVA